MSQIKEMITFVNQNIVEACMKSGRESTEVLLIAVSKTKPVEMIQEAYDLGIRDFGENKVQELLSKMEVLPKDIRWHMIGHLQRNKVKYLVGKVALIHSVDSLRLAEEISKEAIKQNICVDILVEVNVGEEASKFGTSVEGTIALVEQISKLPGICVKGFMTVAPMSDNSESNRIHFMNLRQLAVDIQYKNIDNVSVEILSMGMTGDYKTAIEEGSTCVRVGAGIFGDRKYIN